MENLIFSLNATVPVFLMMVLGFIFRRVGLVDESFAQKINKFVFLVSLPVLVFSDLALTDFVEVWDGTFVIFCFVVTVISITIATLVSFLCKDKSIQGEFVQVSYRSSAALLGIAFIQNIYGTSGMAPLMIIGSVPLYNVMAVIIMSVFQPNNKGIDRDMIKHTVKGIVTNPIIIGIVIGLLWSVLKVPMPSFMEKTVRNIAGTAAPMGLIAMGASFDFKKALAKFGPSVVAVIMKLLVFAMLVLPLAVRMGFREEKLVAILVMVGSASTVSCYIMAKNMGYEGVLSSNVIMLTTLFSAFTLTGWLFLLKSMGVL